MGLSLDVVEYRPSVLWRCWLGHLTRNIVSEMTCFEWDVKPYYNRLCVACNIWDLLFLNFSDDELREVLEESLLYSPEKTQQKSEVHDDRPKNEIVSTTRS